MARHVRNDLLDDIHCYYLDWKNRVIYLHSELDEYEVGVDFRMAATFIKNLDYLNSISHAPITVNFMSFGGDWNYGMAIYDAIKQSPSEITTVSYAHSRSMSSIIVQAAAYRKISKHADFMIHYGTYADEGDMRKVVHGVEHYKKANEVMFNIYTERCLNGEFAQERGYDHKKMYKYLQDNIEKKVDWWMSAEEAVYYGFMDEVI